MKFDVVAANSVVLKTIELTLETVAPDSTLTVPELGTSRASDQFGGQDRPVVRGLAPVDSKVKIIQVIVNGIRLNYGGRRRAIPQEMTAVPGAVGVLSRQCPGTQRS